MEQGSPGAIDGVARPGKGTTAEAWVPRGMVKPSAGNGTGGVNGAGGGGGALDNEEGQGDPMEVEEGEESGEGEEEEGEEDAEDGGEEEGEGEGEDQVSLEKGEEELPTALVVVMNHRNGCKLLLRLLAPEHTG